MESFWKMSFCEIFLKINEDRDTTEIEDIFSFNGTLEVAFFLFQKWDVFPRSLHKPINL